MIAVNRCGDDPHLPYAGGSLTIDLSRSTAMNHIVELSLARLDGTTVEAVGSPLLVHISFLEADNDRMAELFPTGFQAMVENFIPPFGQIRGSELGAGTTELPCAPCFDGDDSDPPPDSPPIE